MAGEWLALGSSPLLCWAWTPEGFDSWRWDQRLPATWRSPKPARAWCPLRSLPLRGCLGIGSKLIPEGPPRCSGGGGGTSVRPPVSPSAVGLKQLRHIQGSAQSKLSTNSHHENNYPWSSSGAHTLSPCVDGGCVKSLSRLKGGCLLSPLSATQGPNQSPPNSLKGSPGEHSAPSGPRGGGGKGRLADVAATEGVIHYPGLMKT